MALAVKSEQVETKAPISGEEKLVIIASSVGTVFEWYDFYLYGSLAAIIAKQFFSGLDPTSAYIFALLAFAAARARPDHETGELSRGTEADRETARPTALDRRAESPRPQHQSEAAGRRLPPARPRRTAATPLQSASWWDETDDVVAVIAADVAAVGGFPMGQELS